VNISIQIPSIAVLPMSLLCKEKRKVTHRFAALKRKNRGWRGLFKRSAPILMAFPYIIGCFASISMKKPLLSW